MFTAIRAVSATLRHHLQAGLAADPVTGPIFGTGGSRTVTLMSPRVAAGESVVGVSLWLYQATRDAQRLNAPTARIAPDQLTPPPLPLELHYLATPLLDVDASDPNAAAFEEHLILGKVLEIFHGHPLLSGLDLIDDLTGSPTQLAVRLEALPLEDVARVWWALQRPYQLSVSYEVTLAEIATGAQPQQRTPVVEARPRHAVAVGAAVRP